MTGESGEKYTYQNYPQADLKWWENSTIFLNVRLLVLATSTDKMYKKKMHNAGELSV